MAQKTVKNRNNIEFLFQDAVKGIPGCSAVIMSDFLHHLPYEKHETCLKRAFNALDNDGVLIIIEADPVSKSIWRYKLGLCVGELLIYYVRPNQSGVIKWDKSARSEAESIIEM